MSVTHPNPAARLGLLWPPLVLYCADIFFTLTGQSRAYWGGDYASVEEYNPVAHFLLTLGPMVFVALAALWFILVSLIVFRWRHPLVVVIAFAMTFTHAIGAASWLPRHGVAGWIAAFGVLILAERLWSYGAESFLSKQVMSGK